MKIDTKSREKMKPHTSNDMYSSLEAILMVMAYHCGTESCTPSHLVDLCKSELGFSVSVATVRCILRDNRFNRDSAPDNPFVREKEKWRLNPEAKMNFDDHEWEEWIFSPVRSHDNHTEIEVDHSSDSDSLQASEALVTLGSRPSELDHRVEYLESEFCRLEEIERLYYTLKSRMDSVARLLNE